MIHHRRCYRQARKGTILILTAIMMVVMMGFIAFSVDLGYLYNARTELQRAADASAIAGCWELLNRDVTGTANSNILMENARSKAVEFAGYNRVLNTTPTVANSDIHIGYIANPLDPTSPFLTMGYSGNPNAVRVTVRREAAVNGDIPLFFAPVLGVDSAQMNSQATAALLNDFQGFRAPSDGSNLGILPFALDEVSWNGLLAGAGNDAYRYNEGGACTSVTTAPDGIKEVNLYPQGTGSPGNRGTVDIGGANNSTADIARQIVYGISASDLNCLGGALQFNSAGVLLLNGDTGISAGVKDELASIIGQTRMIPIFRSVSGPGNNATYTIVKFVGIRVMYVKLTGSMSSKQVMVQPAAVMTKGGIRGMSSNTQFVWSPAWLVR